MLDVRNYSVQEKLKNGLSTTIRAIRPDDKNRIIAAFKELEPQSIYTRFFNYKQKLSDKELERATEVDFENEVALVATVRQENQEIIIGSGRYFVYSTPKNICSAEIAFIVEEDYHGQGIASNLLRHLTCIAREKGVKRFTAEILPDNHPMLAVFSHSDLPLETKQLADIVQITLSIAE